MGVPPGDDTDFRYVQMLKAALMASSANEEEEEDESSPRTEKKKSSRRDLDHGLTITWLHALVGRLFGFGLGLFLVDFTNDVFTMMMAGIITIPAIIIFYVVLPNDTFRDDKKQEEKMEDEEKVEVVKKDDCLWTQRGEIWEDVVESVKAQSHAFQLVFGDWRSGLLAFAYLFIAFTRAGTLNFGVFWGEVIYEWTPAEATVFFVNVTLAPIIGAFLITGKLAPWLGYTKALTYVISLSASVCTGLAMGIFSPVMVFFALVLAVLAFGAYASVLALLTENVPHANVGHLQGCLFAFIQLGTLSALGLYLVAFAADPVWLWIMNTLGFAVCSILISLAGDGGDVKKVAGPSYAKYDLTVLDDESPTELDEKTTALV